MKFNEDDLIWDIYRAYTRDRTEAAVRLRHIATGIVVYSTQEYSLYQNKKTALSLLEEQVEEFYKKEQNV